jgi:hypothetical protein
VRRNWFVAAIVVAIAVIIAVVVIARGDDDASGNPDATSWAGSVCTSLLDWRSSVSTFDVSGAALSRDALREKLDDAQTATDRLVTELKDLGAPDLESGSAVKEKLDADADAIDAGFQSLKSTADDALNTSSTTAFVSALAAIAGDLQSLLTRITTTVEDVQNADVSDEARAELEQAFRDAEPCQQLREDQD